MKFSTTFKTTTTTLKLILVILLIQKTSGQDLEEYQLDAPATKTDPNPYKTEVAPVKLQVKSKKNRCPNHKVKGWYEFTPEGTVRNPGLPPGGTRPDVNDGSPVPYNFVQLPGNMTKCDLEELHDFCVAEINRYRSGELKFNDGTDDPDVLAGLHPLIEATGNNRCSSETSLSAMALHYSDGKCNGAHKFAFKCPWKGAAAQNSCCMRGDHSWGRWDRKKYTTKDLVKEELRYCLRQMWNEGIKDGQKGHWRTMKSKTYNYISCGFAWSEQGRIMMRQDFTKELGGQWYCRRPGKRRGRFKKEHCELDCVNKAFRQTRCCGERTGIICTKNEIVPRESCKAVELVC